MVQWLGLHTFTAKGPGSSPGRETKVLRAVWPGQKRKKKKRQTTTKKTVPPPWKTAQRHLVTLEMQLTHDPTILDLEPGEFTPASIRIHTEICSYQPSFITVETRKPPPCLPAVKWIHCDTFLPWNSTQL